MSPRIRVLVVDDQALMRSGLIAVLAGELDLEVVGEAADGRRGVEQARALRPDVVLMDVRMPVLDGVAATAEIRSAAWEGERPRVLILTTFDLDEFVHSALRAGAAGFLLKDAPPEELLRAIRVVAAGESLLAPSVTRRLIDHFAEQQPAPTRALVTGRAQELVARLTPREGEILRLLARGRTNPEIAAALFVTESTVKTHVTRIFAKCEVTERVQAAVVAFDAGLVVPGDE